MEVSFYLSLSLSMFQYIYIYIPETPETQVQSMRITNNFKEKQILVVLKKKLK